jgi:Pvc16 N-terminal domain/Carboxypeptidase regulatory-like domain
VIKELDASLETLLTSEAATGSELAAATISFSVPDEDWRGAGTGLDLDIYLYQISENRDLRSNERRYRPQVGGGVDVDPFPTRVECCYLITAWNKADDTGGEDRELQEHRLLSQVLYALLRNPTMPITYMTAPLVAAQELTLPVITAQLDGAGTTADFWTGLGTYLRPSVTCKVTLALELGRSFRAAEVTLVHTRVNGEMKALLAGRVWDSGTPRSPVAGAWVRVVETGELAVTDVGGEFLLEHIAAGTYTLVVRAPGFQEGGGGVNVPAPDGQYDVTLAPL